MQNLFQKTLAKPISFRGIGLHSGKESNIKLVPLEANKGIIFKRIDLKKNNLIKANYQNVTSAKLCTTLENSFGANVSTVEHLMAALYISGIDNILIEIDSSEVPIMDGSSKDFINLIKQAGVKDLLFKRKFLKIIKAMEFIDGEKTISIEPTEKNDFSLEVDFQLNYQNEIIGKQRNKIKFDDSNLEDIYSSRTFCLFEDIEKIKESGLAKGGSLNNAVVVKKNEILNEGGLRNKKEFVNHKILDLAGDFLLSGYRIAGSVKCYQGGHHLSNNFLRELFKDKTSYIEINRENIDIIKKDFKISTDKIAVNA